MRVLHVISDANIGGAGVLLTTLLRNLDRERVTSAVALPRGSALCERIKTLDIPIYPLEHPCDRVSLSSVREIGRLSRELNADLIHANAALSARVAGKGLGMPVVHTRHCCDPSRGIYRALPIRAVGGMCNRMLSDRVIATADAAAENLHELGIPKEKITVILNGSEQVRQVTKEECAAFRARFGIEENAFCIGICARLEDCKGHDILLRAAKRVCERLSQMCIRFLIVGTGSRQQALEEMARELGISDVVRFLGFVEDMAPVYRTLRINVNCSRGTETSCLALSEGMSASLPTIASRYGGNGVMLGQGEAGLLFPVNDDAALAEAICTVVTHPEEERRLGLAARQRYLQCYTARAMTERVTEVYESLCK